MSNSVDAKYHKVEDEADSADLIYMRGVQASQLLRTSFIIFAIFASFLAGIGATFMLPEREVTSSAATILPIFQHYPPKLGLTCGNSTTQAIALDCIFDPLTVSWLPRGCPTDATEEFVKASGGPKWRYYYDSEGKHEIVGYEPLSEMVDVHYYSTSREHAQHCAYMMMRFFHVLKRGGRLDSMSADPYHWDHCVEIMSNIINSYEDKVNAMGIVEFLGC
jgi:hypothetical protein